MYEQHFGFKAKPFSLLPNPAFLFMSRKHEVAMSILEYAVTNELVLSVVTGEVGSGKTTLVRNLLNQLNGSHTVGLISNTHRDFDNLMQTVAAAFGIPFAGKGKVELHQEFVDFLIAEYSAGRRTLLIVDEAQNLSPETLEEIRLLTNINADDHTLLQLLLVGQPELHEMLKRRDLRQLAQRISVMARLDPLDEKETAEYVKHRLTVAGGDPKLFHKNALRLVFWNSEGIPRVINTLCDLALVYAFADRKRHIDAVLIADIARDRIDTGLYGEDVFDVKNLKEVDLAARHERALKKAAAAAAKAQAAAAKASAVPSPVAGAGAENKVFDLHLDGSAAADAGAKKRTSAS